MHLQQFTIYQEVVAYLLQAGDFVRLYWRIEVLWTKMIIIKANVGANVDSWGHHSWICLEAGIGFTTK